MNFVTNFVNNFVTKLVTNSVTSLVNHQIGWWVWWCIWWYILWQIWWQSIFTKFSDKFVTEFIWNYIESPNVVIFCDQIRYKLRQASYMVRNLWKNNAVKLVTVNVTKRRNWFCNSSVGQRARETLKAFGPTPHPPSTSKVCAPPKGM